MYNDATLKSAAMGSAIDARASVPQPLITDIRQRLMAFNTRLDDTITRFNAFNDRLEGVQKPGVSSDGRSNRPEPPGVRGIADELDRLSESLTAIDNLTAGLNRIA